MKFTFGNVSIDEMSENELSENFYIIDYCGDEVYYISKEIFEHEPGDENENFRYRYVIVLRDYSAYSDDLSNFGAYMYMLPLANSIRERLISFGYEYEDNEDLNSIEFARDAISEEYGILFLKDENINFDANNEESYLKAKERAHECAVIAANTFIQTDRMRGFYLDRCQNLLGTKGWDKINDWVFEKGDYIKLTFEH